MAEYRTYREMPELLERRQEFRGNSVRAFKDWEDNYIVMSYDTIIYAQCAGGWYFDNTFYSPTTSKLQNLLIWNVLPAMFGRYQRKAYIKGDVKIFGVDRQIRQMQENNDLILLTEWSAK